MQRIKLILFFIFSLLAGWAIAQQPAKPNVIIILADDLGYGDVGFNSCLDIPTPNIDKIATNGVRFTNAYVSYSVCGPSRAGLITGRYQDRFGFGRNPLLAPKDTAQGLPSSEETLASALKKADYKSMALGKWHLGAHESQYPLKRGFDEFFGFLGGGHEYFPDAWTLNDLSEIKQQFDGYKTKLMRNNGRVDENEYLTDALTREAVSFVERNSGEPFFMYLAYNAPHTPLQASTKYLNRFDHIKDEKRKIYAAMVSAVDDGVGALVGKLRQLGIEENTMIFFLSDNGGPEYHNASDNGPLRDGKGSLFEGGIRIPFAMQWTGYLPKGLVYHQPVISLDIFATAVHYAQVLPKNKIDGVNLIPFINGENKGKPHESLYWRKFDQKSFAIRHGELKLVKYKTETEHLYNLTEDIGEQNKLPTQEEKVLLKTMFNNWNSEITDPAFLGLVHDKKYSALHPDRFKLVNPYRPDSLLPKIPEGYELTWSDEFNTDGKPDERYWSYETGFIRNHELQWYQSDNANVINGVLVIEGKNERVKNPAYKAESKNWKLNREYAEYTSACIKTRNKFSFKYGIMEVRARIDTSIGLWPAIWTLGEHNPWPANGEVDQLEYYRYEGKAVILANAAWADSQNKAVWDSEKIPLSYFINKQPDWLERFHIWKMEWNEDHIRLYLDDELLNEIDLKTSLNPDGRSPFHQAQYILLNQAIGSNGGDPGNTTFPRKYEIDYVRVFQKK